MPNVRVVTDSACDIPAELAAELGIEVVPLSIRFGDEEFVDRKDLTPQQFWQRVAASPMLPETAAPSPGAFEAVFRSAAADGCSGVVCVTLSSRLSATFEVAQLAAKALAGDFDVRGVDSLSITMGQGSMVMAGARAAAGGASLDDVESLVRSFVGRTKVFGALDTLDNLKKGGRIGAAQALIGSLLSVKPIVDVSSGAAEQAGKQRTRRNALAHLANLAAEAKAAHGSVENLAVMHGDASDVDVLLDLLDPVFGREGILVGQIGAVIGTHGGPRVMGMTFNLPSSTADASTPNTPTPNTSTADAPTPSGPTLPAGA